MMNDMELGEGIARQELNVIFVIDNSGSMAGERLGAVNNAIRDIMAIMPDIQDDTSDAEIKIAALTFSDIAKWVNPEPMKVGEFKWTDIKAEGGTNLGDAYNELAKCLSKRSKGGKMPDLGGVSPIIILMTDGMPNYGWEENLKALRRKGWFKVALKYALAIGIDTDAAMDVLNQFTGNSETVLKVYSAEALRQVIKVIAVTASKVKSSSSTTSVGNGGAVASNDAAQNAIAEGLKQIENVEW